MEQFRPAASPARTGGGVRGGYGTSQIGGSQLSQLAQALSGVNTAVGSAAKNFIDKEITAAAAKYGEELASTTDDQIEDYRERAIQEGLNDFQMKALDSQFGARLANKRRRDLLQRVESGEIDLSTQDIDGFVQGMMKSDREAYQSSDFAASYSAIMGKTLGELRNAGAKAVGQRVRKEIEDNYYGLLQDQVAEADRAGKSAEEIASEVLTLRAAHGPNSPFKMDRRRANGVVLQFAADLARDGREDVVTAILDKPQADGGPALSKIKEFAEISDKIRDVAKDTAQEKLREANYERTVALFTGVHDGSVSSQEVLSQTGYLQELGFSERGVASLFRAAQATEERAQKAQLAAQAEAARDEFRQAVALADYGALLGGTLESGDPDTGYSGIGDIEQEIGGKTVRISATDRRQAAIDMLVSRVGRRFEPQINKYRSEAQAYEEAGEAEKAQAARDQLATLEEKRDLSVFTALQRNGISKWPALEQTLQAGFYAAKVEGADAPAAQKALQTYMRLKSVDPVWAEKLAGNQDVADFYEMVDTTSRELYGGNLDKAFQNVRLRDENDGTVRWLSEAVARSDKRLDEWVDDAADELDGTLPQWLGGDANFSGSELAMKGRIFDLAQMYAAHGVADARTAVKMATERVVKNTTMVSGYPVQKTEINLAVPENLQRLSDAVAKGVTSLPGYEDRDPDEFVVLPSTRDARQFEVYEKGTGLPIMPTDRDAKMKLDLAGETWELQPNFLNRSDLDRLSTRLILDHVHQVEEDRKASLEDRKELESFTEDMDAIGDPGDKRSEAGPSLPRIGEGTDPTQRESAVVKLPQINWGAIAPSIAGGND